MTPQPSDRLPDQPLLDAMWDRWQKVETKELLCKDDGDKAASQKAP